MSATSLVMGDGISVLSLDDDPNVTAPDPSRLLVSAPSQSDIYFVCEGTTGGHVTFVVWGYDPTLDRWLQFVTLQVFEASDFMVNSYMTFNHGIDHFLQVVDVTNVTRLSIGYWG